MPDRQRIFEEYLLLSAQSGDAAALRTLVGLRHPRLIAHAIRLLGDAEQARDVVQEAWIEILRGLPSLREPRAFPAWAFRIVTRRAARLIGGLQRQRQLALDAAVVAEDGTLGDAEALADAAAVRAALDTLPPGQKAAVALFYLDEMSVAEVATALDIPAGTVKTRLMHARAALKAALKGDGDDEAR